MEALRREGIAPALDLWRLLVLAGGRATALLLGG